MAIRPSWSGRSGASPWTCSPPTGPGCRSMSKISPTTSPGMSAAKTPRRGGTSSSLPIKTWPPTSARTRRQPSGDIPAHWRRRLNCCPIWADTWSDAAKGPDRVNRPLVRGFYIFVPIVECPLLAWNLAVDATNRGLGWRGFFIALLGLPVLGAVLAAALLRRRRREATFGAIGALTATLVLVVVLVFVTLSSR